VRVSFFLYFISSLNIFSPTYTGTVRARFTVCLEQWWLRGLVEQEARTQSLCDFKSNVLMWSHEDGLWFDRGKIAILIYACIYNQLHVVKEILQSTSSRVKKNQLRSRTLNGVADLSIPRKMTPLHIAMSLSSVDIVNLLLEHGANHFHVGVFGFDAVMFACATGRLDNVKYWYQKFPDWDFTRTMVSFLPRPFLQSYNNNNTNVHKQYANGSNALVIAQYMGPCRLALVKFLVEVVGLKLQTVNNSGENIVTNIGESGKGTFTLC